MSKFNQNDYVRLSRRGKGLTKNSKINDNTLGLIISYEEKTEIYIVMWNQIFELHSEDELLLLDEIDNTIVETLRKFIKSVLNERIRSKTFDLEYFKSIDDLNEINQYARETLEYIDSGSARTCFILSSKKVLKVAKIDKENFGIRQNRSEWQSSKNSHINDMFPKILNFDLKFQWLISELVKPFKKNDFEELENNFGLKFGTFRRVVDTAFITGHQNFLGNSLSSMIEKCLPHVDNSEKALVLIRFLNNVLQRSKTNPMDFDRSENWGKTTDGRIVLLDHGLSTDMMY